MKRLKNPVTFIFITVLVDCIGIGIIFPVIASLITEVSHVPVNKATTYSGWMMTLYALMQFIFTEAKSSMKESSILIAKTTNMVK